jgi:TonB-linked SusC/RagA family outer membrane protein
MRLTVILLIAFVLHAGARGTAQTVTLSVTNMPLEQVCKQIERQTGYYFVYAQDLIKTSKNVSMSVDKANIIEALRLVFDGQPFTYQIIDKVIVVNTLHAAGRLPLLPAEMIKVEGVVLSEQGQPVAEANVTIKATGKGTFTNAKGEFMLPSVPANSDLVISHVGFRTETVVAKTGKLLEVRLGQAVSSLDATVVKGYYVTSNRLNTGNVATVKGEDIAKQPVSDPVLALEGRVAGLSIAQTSGAPGSYSTVRLRGQNTIQQGKPVTANDPLYIVDGIPFSSQSLTSPYIGGGGAFQRPISGYGNYGDGIGQGMSPFNSLNPADIESIDVLKDADATAIYGSRGANGVILITTKKGKIGRSKLDVNVYTGASKVTRKMQLLNTQQYLQMKREAFQNDNFSQLLVPANAQDYPDILLWDTTRYTDWQKILIGNSARFTNAQLNYSGGNANTQFLISGGYSRQGVVIPGDFLDQKTSLHASVTQVSSNQRLHTQLSVSYVNDNSNLSGPDFTSYITTPPDAPAIYDANGNVNWQIYHGAQTWINPFGNLTSHAKAISEYMAGSLSLKYTVLHGLNFSCNLGYSQQRMNQANTSPSRNLAPPHNNDPRYRSSSFSLANSQSWIMEPQLSYSKMIGKGILEILAGLTFQESSGSSMAETASGFTSDALIGNIMAASVSTIAGNDNSLYRYNALFARAGYTLDDKYVLNFTARRDGSSRFGPQRQFGNFGAVGAAWIFSKEKFLMDRFPALSFGKLRGSYGVTGNDAIGDYQFLSTYTTYQTAYQGIVGLYPNKIPNPYLEWERVRKLEGGVELGFFKDAVLFTASYYRNRTDNQLVGYPVPAIAGFSSVESNLPALIQNTGWEFTAQTRNIDARNFTWSTTFNLAISRNKLLRYPGIETSPYKSSYKVGESLSGRYVYHYTGVDPETGIYKFQSKSGSGSPQSVDRIFTKPITQYWFGGIENRFSCHGFHLDVLLQVINQLGMNYLRFFSMPGNVSSKTPNQPIEIVGRWQKPGDKANVQRYGVVDPATTGFNNLALSDAAFSDASFIRVKNIAFFYDLPKPWLKKAGLETARFYLQCQNLFTITKYRGLDPESQGLSLPPLRTVTGGIQFTF